MHLRNIILAFVCGLVVAVTFDNNLAGVFTLLLAGIWFSAMDAVDLLAKLERR